MLYNIALIVHIAGVGILIAADILSMAILARLRKTRTVGEVRATLAVGIGIPKLHMVSGLCILVAGVYMGFDSWGWTIGWLDVSLVAFIIAAAIGTAVMGKRVEEVAKLAFASPEGELTGELREKAHGPGNLVFETTMTFWIGGFVYVMIAKPGWIGSIVSMLVALAIGQLLGRYVFVTDRQAEADQGASQAPIGPVGGA